MNTATPHVLDSVQRIVLRGGAYAQARHLVLHFPKGPMALRFLCRLQAELPALWPTPARCAARPEVQISLGFSCKGLEAALVPPHVLARFALKSPAFSAGAARRASSRLGATGPNAASHWDDAFGCEKLHAVLSVHGRCEAAVGPAVDRLCQLAKACGVRVDDTLPKGLRLPQPAAVTSGATDAQWMHFGFRDGLSRIGIEGWNSGGEAPAGRRPLKPLQPHSIFPAGEFVLGHAQQSGANPWIAGPGLRVWPDVLRSFFHNGSFGVLHQVQQHVDAFETFIGKTVEAERKRLDTAPAITAEALKAKLCGRWPDGRPLADDQAPPEDDFNYAQDPQGERCPYASHIRRMNPRGGDVVQGRRVRPLLRRGMPYGAAWRPGDGVDRGLLAQFFCASIEDQFEHLIGQWAERMPMGSGGDTDPGRARDPLIGDHSPGDGPYVIPRSGQSPWRLSGLTPYTRTRGVAYLFYPSLPTLAGIAQNQLWVPDADDETDT